MKFLKGNKYRCVKANSDWFTKGKVYESLANGTIKDDCGESVYVNGSIFEPVNSYPIPDPINPDHYKSYSVECIDMMVAIWGKEKAAIHCELTAFKYRMRAGKKGPVEECMQKEKWYLDKAKELRK